MQDISRPLPLRSKWRRVTTTTVRAKSDTAQATIDFHGLRQVTSCPSPTTTHNPQHLTPAQALAQVLRGGVVKAQAATGRTFSSAVRESYVIVDPQPARPTVTRTASRKYSIKPIVGLLQRTGSTLQRTASTSQRDEPRRIRHPRPPQETPTHKERELPPRMPSQSALTREEKDKIKASCPNGSGKILSAAVGRIYYAYPDPDQWTFAGQEGATALFYDKGKGAFVFRMIDLKVRFKRIRSKVRKVDC